ncbi:HD family phosphohydrolase [Porphyromonas circumdentaria]|uniref:HD family phosphohydrolase n=1 Tax=Porphyromonas circumdentaria TaxID=29524 RepID=UPI0026DD40CC|nr:HDIG domain-containing metalloprotein [Porphyromonas circumdentaria]MDO4721804.1 HDIG domain-containing protein [Porphyromonas circumdentaria]
MWKPQKYRLTTSIQSLLIFVITGIIIVIFAPKEQKFMYTFEKGQVWKHELLVAPYDITLLKPKEVLQEERDSIAKEILPYYMVDREVDREALRRWEHDYETLYQKTYSEDYYRYVKNKLEDFYQRGLVSHDDLEEMRAAQILEVNLINEEKESTRYSTTLFLSLKEAYQDIISQTPDYLERRNIQHFNIDNYLRANTTPDKITYDKVVREEQQKISNSTGVFVAGRRIISKGDVIDDYTYNVLKSYKKMFEERSGADRTFLGRVIGLFVIIMILLGALWAYFILFRNSIFQNAKNAVFIAGSILIFVLITEIAVSLWHFDVYIIPYIILPLLVRIFFDSRSAFFVHTVTILIAMLFVPQPLDFVLLQLAAGMVTIFSLKNLTSRSQLIRTTFLVFLTYVLLSLSVSFLQSGVIDKVQLKRVLSFGINMIFLMFTYVLVYLMEKIFGYISNISLVELSDINRPLLRQLSEYAPGTFQHSMQVSILATDAAQSIDADVQLTRTGALYHDIGKMLNAAFFTENNQGGRNPHDDLDYKESAAIIIKHVTDGIALAQKHKLPPQVIDFIRTHHGKGRTKYFYTMYCNEHPGEVIDPTPFTYPGPNPFSRETGILMLADAVEASSRSLKEYTETSIKELVERIVDSIVAERLLDNTPLTFRNIKTIKEVFIKKLLTMNHSRIAYPRAQKEEQETQQEEHKL